MKREDLKNLGLDDKQLNEVMKLHGKSVNEVKSNYSDYEEIKAQNKNYSDQIKKNDNDLKTLRKNAKDNDELTSKITKLENENKTSKTNFENQIKEVKLNSAINNSLTNAKVRNNKAIMPLLNKDNIKFDDKGNLTGLDDQVEGLKKSDSYLFNLGSKEGYDPHGNEGGTPTAEEGFKSVWGGNDNKK